MEYEMQKYINGDIEIEVKVTPLDNTIWMTQEQIGLLFNRSQSVVSRYINMAFKEGNFDRDTSIRFLHKSTQNAPSYRHPEHYNLDIVMFVGKKVKFKELQSFDNWAKEILGNNEKPEKEPNIIVLNDRNLSLDVKIMPEENTVYLTKEQMSLLFGRSVSVIS